MFDDSEKNNMRADWEGGGFCVGWNGPARGKK